MNQLKLNWIWWHICLNRIRKADTLVANIQTRDHWHDEMNFQTWCIKCTFFYCCLYTLRRDASLQSYSFKLTWQITRIRKWSHSIHLSRYVRLPCFLLCTKWDKFSTMCINWDTVDRMSDSKTWCLSWLSINEDYHCDILKSVAWWHWWVDVKKRGRRRIVLARERVNKDPTHW